MPGSQPRQSPTNSISGSSVTPARSATTVRTCSARRRTSAAVPRWSLTMKFACFSDTAAPPIRVPFSPAASIRRPAESPGGLRNTLPADGIPSGWWVRRHVRISSRLAAIAAGSAGVRWKVASITSSGGAPSGDVLEAAVAVGEPEVRDVERALRAVRGQHARRSDDAGDVPVVCPGVGPDRATDRARDRQAELEAGQAGLLGLGRGAGHLDARLGHQPLPVDADALGADLDDQAADAGIGDDQVAPPPQQEVRQVAAARELDELAQLEPVVRRRRRGPPARRRAWS